MLMIRLSQRHRHRSISHLLSVWTKMPCRKVEGAHCVKGLATDHNKSLALQLQLGKGPARPQTRPKTSFWKFELILLRIRSVSEAWLWRSVLIWKTASNRNTTTSILIRTSMTHISSNRNSKLKKRSSSRPRSWDFATNCTHGMANQRLKERSTLRSS